MRRRGFLGSAAAVLTLGTGCLTVQAAEETVTDTYDAPDEAVRVTNPDGDVTVHTGDREDVQVRAVKHDSLGNTNALSKVTVTTERSGGTLSVGIDDDTDGDGTDATWVDLRVTVPTERRVPAVTAGDGDVEVRETTGDLTVDAGDGDVDIREVDGGVELEAGDGDVTVREVAGDVDLSAEDGDVTVRETSGDTDVSAGDGDVTVRDVGGHVDLTGGDGDATVRGVEGRVTAELSDGDLTVADVGAVADLTAADGDIDAEIPAVEGETRVSSGDGDVDATLSPDVDLELTLRSESGDLLVSGFDFVAADDVSRVETTFGEGTDGLTIAAEDGDVSLSPL